MNSRFARLLVFGAFFIAGLPVSAQQQAAVTGQPLAGDVTSKKALPASSGESNAAPKGNALPSATASAPSPAPKPKPAPVQHKLGPLNISVNWRLRTEALDWFQPASGETAYGFGHSLLRVGIGQKSENFDWFLEGAQDAIFNLPTAAIVPGRPGQLGLGGTYFAANGNGENNANGFVKQAYVGFKL